MSRLPLIMVGVAAFIALMNIVLWDDTLQQVQAGTITLQCHMSDGTRVIEPAKVKDLFDGTWVFTNGHSKQCEVIHDAR